MSQKGQYAVELLEGALDVIEGIASLGNRARRSSDLALQLGLNRSRVFRILKTLEQRGYVDYDSSQQGYRLGLKFLTRGEEVKENLDLRNTAAPILMELAQQTGDVANLLVRYSRTSRSSAMPLPP